DTEVSELHDQATEAFSNLYADGEAEFSDSELEALEGLTSVIETQRGEQEAREAAAQVRAQKAKDFAVRVNGEAAAEDDNGDVEITTLETEDTADGTVEDTVASKADGALASEKDNVVSATASATPNARRVTLAGTKSRQRPPQREE